MVVFPSTLGHGGRPSPQQSDARFGQLAMAFGAVGVPSARLAPVAFLVAVVVNNSTSADGFLLHARRQTVTSLHKNHFPQISNAFSG